jgi:hypothetical protein
MLYQSTIYYNRPWLAGFFRLDFEHDPAAAAQHAQRNAREYESSS